MSWALSPLGRWHFMTLGEFGLHAACGNWTHSDRTPLHTSEQRPRDACAACVRIAGADVSTMRDAARREHDRLRKRKTYGANKTQGGAP